LFRFSTSGFNYNLGSIYRFKQDTSDALMKCGFSFLPFDR